MPWLVWAALLGLGGWAIASKGKPAPYPGFHRVDLRLPWLDALASQLTASGQNAILSPDGEFMLVRNGEVVEVYQRD